MSPDSPQPQPLARGSRVGSYELSERIGVGGMGQVYRATDTKLRRSVAMKVLPPAVADDPERLARFEREARLLAQLQHPNIAAIFGLEESDGVSALVLELVEGPTLAERLEAGPMPLETAIAIAVQMAQALEHAHARGIVHRDLKPQNVKAPVDGEVKVLDFGLAKAIEAGATTDAPAEHSMSPTMLESPTLTAVHGTQLGMILGTAAYMSPEQAKGAAIDKRADIWAFGVVLYEMLVGKSLFAGDSVADTLAGVLKAKIDLSALPPRTPAALRRLVRRCLQRNPHDRLHDIADARIVLQEVAADPEGKDGIQAAAATPPASIMARCLPWAVAALGVAAAIGFGLRATVAPEPSGRALTAFGVLVPADHYLPQNDTPLLDLADDGQTMLVVAEGERGPSIFLRRFDRLGFTRVEGSEGAERPILSPDGRTIAFFASGQLHKIPAEGGEPVALAAARTPRGACWAPDGSIIFSPMYNSGLWRVPSAGGAPVEVTHLDESAQERTHRWPQLLPDGNTLIFTVGLTENTSDYDVARIGALRLDTGERRTILENARMARYTSGYLVFQRRQTLLAVRFDPERLAQIGNPFVLREGVGGDPSSGAGYFAVSAGGAVLFAPKDVIMAGESVMVLRDREGNETELPLQPASFITPRMSPSGDRLAFAMGTGGMGVEDDVYLYDLASGRLQQMTFDHFRGFPLWSPDGARILYTVGTSGERGLATRAADGSGSETIVPVQSGSSSFLIVDAWLAGDRLIGTDVERSLDVFEIDAGTGAITPLLANPQVAESAAAVSPNGRFIAYSSTESGAEDVFVESFPRGAGKWQVSRDGGSCPAWSRNGGELYFVRGSKLMAVAVDAQGIFRSGPPHELFRGPYNLCVPARRGYDVTPDGGFVLIKSTLAPGAQHQMVLLQGWESMDPARATDR